MPAPEFTLPTTGTSPKIATRHGLEAGINAVSQALFDQIGAISTGLKPVGNWDASSGSFPSGAERGTYYMVNVAGTVDGAAFAIGDWLIPLVDGPETGTYADNWFRGDYSKVVPAKPDSAAAFAAGSDVSRGPGALWETKDGYRYEEVTTGEDLTNAAGVKLNVLRAPNAGMFRPEQWGGTEASHINKAQEAALDAGGFPVQLIGPSYNINEPVIIQPGCGLVGLGSKGVVLRLANGVNDDSIRTADFATLTGSNDWLVSEGVPTGFQLKGFTLNGNKANNAAGAGVKIYGKRYFADDLIIYDAKGDSFYTECALKGGQTEYDDLPETSVTNIYMWRGDARGFACFGPHDGYIDRIYSAVHAGDGVLFGSDFATNNGATDVGFIHSYANLVGINIETRVNALYLQVESNYAEGLIVDNSDTTIGQLRAFKNFREFEATEAAQGDASVWLKGATKIGQVMSRTDNGGTALKVTGSGSHVGHAEIHGENNNGIGLDLDANQCDITARIFDFDGGTGTGVRVGASGSVNGNTLNFTSRACDEHYNNVSAGSKSNRVDGDIFTLAGEVAVAGQVPDVTERYDITSRGDTDKATKRRGAATIPDATNFVTITHSLLYTPGVDDISVTFSTALATGVTWRVTALTSTTFQVQTSAAVSGDKSFGWQASVTF
jgi:hypothetical protein